MTQMCKPICLIYLSGERSKYGHVCETIKNTTMTTMGEGRGDTIVISTAL